MFFAVMAADFSYMFDWNALAYEYAISRGEPVTDQMMCDAVMHIQPPPLEPILMEQLLTELDESKRRKTGRPEGDKPIRIQLAGHLVDVPESMMPKLLRDCLIARLQSGLRCTESERSDAFKRRMAKLDRDMFIRGLYQDFLPIIQSGRQLVHEVLGPIDESCALESDSPSQKTLAIVADLMGNKKWGLHPPSMRRMQNIIYRKPKRKTCTKFTVR